MSLLLVSSLLLNFVQGIAVPAGSAQLAQELREPAGEIPQDLVITLERVTSSWGSPLYKVTIHADGALTYEGKEFVAVKGTLQDRISQHDIRWLIAEFERVDYFSLCDFYLSDPRNPGDCCFPPPAPRTDGLQVIGIPPTDHQRVRTSIRINGRTKTIDHYHGCPEGKDLIGFEDKIDEIIGTKRWISRGSAP